jgi:hypothetical protein
VKGVQKIVLSTDHRVNEFKLIMSLKRYIDSLPKRKQFEVAIKLARLAMPMWNEYVATTPYQKDGYVYYLNRALGGEHLISKDLLPRTVDSIEKYVHTDFNPVGYDAQKFNALMNECLEGIHGLEWEQDWELEKPLKLLVFAVYNLLEAAMVNEQSISGESMIYVSVNQSVDALTASGRMTFEEVHIAIGLITPGL